MMQLCKEKGCWLRDLHDVPADEYDLWLAFYDLEYEDQKRAHSRAEAEARMAANRR